MSVLTKSHTRTISTQTDFHVGVQKFESVTIEIKNNGASAISSIVTARQIDPDQEYYDYLTIKADYQDAAKAVSYGGSNIFDLMPAASGFIQLPCSGFHRYRLRITPVASTTIRLTTTLSDEIGALSSGSSSFVTVADEAARLAIASPDPNKFYHQLDNDTYWKWNGSAWVQTNPFGSGGISTVFGRTGPSIFAQSGDYSSAQVSHDTGNVEDKLDELETNGATNASAIATLQTSETAQDAAIALNAANITANTTAITGNTNAISTLQATQGATDASLQNQITASNTDIFNLFAAVAGKADTVHSHTLANITDAGNVAGLNYGTLLNTAAGQLNVDFSQVAETPILDNTDEFVIKKSDGTHRRITKSNLFSQVLTGAGYAGIARVNGDVLEDRNNNPITDVNGSSGRWYWIGTGGTVNLGSGNLALGVFDLIAHDNGAYDHIINDNAITGVASFNGRTGVIVPTLGDYTTDLIGDDSTAGNANLTLTIDALLSQQATNTSGIATNTGNIATNTAAIAAIDTSNKVTKGGDDQAIVVGTNTVDTLELKTANTGRLWITGSGNVGFKVANPQTDFDFDGGVRFRNLTEQTSYTRFPVVDTSGNFGWRAIAYLLLRNDLATQAEAQNGTDNTKWMSPLRVKEAIATQVQQAVTIPLGQPEGLIISRVDGTTLQFNAVNGLNQAIIQFPSGDREWVRLANNYSKTLSPYVFGHNNGGLIPGNTASGSEDIFIWLLGTDIGFSNDETGASIDAWNPNIGKRCLGVLLLSNGQIPEFNMSATRHITANFEPISYPISVQNWSDYPLPSLPNGSIECDVLVHPGFPVSGGAFTIKVCDPLSASFLSLASGDGLNINYNATVSAENYEGSGGYHTQVIYSLLTKSGKISASKNNAINYLDSSHYTKFLPIKYRYKQQ